MYMYLSKKNTWSHMKGNYLWNLQSADKAGPGHWNDPDLLQIGKGYLSLDEEKTHFALWAFGKAPLLMNTDLTKLPDDSLKVIKNEDLIAINQDGYGNQATCFSGCEFSSISTFTASVLQDDVYLALLAVNWDDSKEQKFSFKPEDYYTTSTPNDKCTIYDLNTGKVTSNIPTTQATDYPLAPHASQALKFKCLPF